MQVSRRHFLALSVGAMLAGCAQDTATELPEPNWPAPVDRPKTTGAIPTPRQNPAIQPGQPATPVQPANPPQIASPTAPTNTGPLRAIPRAAWTRVGVVPDRINPMGGVNRITVHHEGWKTVYFTDYASTAARLDEIRASHLNRLGAGDIAYHYVVDRAGRLWQGRDVRYQGAHVRSENEHNVGVMCLGNFEEQSPTDVQIQTLRETLTQLMKHYRVPVSRVYTHRELNPTACPGRALQPRMVQLRRGGYLA